MVLAAETSRLPTVNLVYDGCHLKARVGSCAGSSIVGEKLAKMVSRRPTKNVAVVKGVCGTLVPIRSETKLSVEVVDAARMSFGALVMESCDEDLLIGTDVLHAAKCVMDFGNKTMTFPLMEGGTVVIPYTCEPMGAVDDVEVAAMTAGIEVVPEPLCCLTQPTKMAGHSSGFNQLRVKAKDGLGVFLPTGTREDRSWARGMMWAPALTHARDGVVTVSVMNVKASRQRVPAGKTAELWTPLSDELTLVDITSPDASVIDDWVSVVSQGMAQKLPNEENSRRGH